MPVAVKIAVVTACGLLAIGTILWVMRRNSKAQKSAVGPGGRAIGTPHHMSKKSSGKVEVLENPAPGPRLTPTTAKQQKALAQMTGDNTESNPPAEGDAKRGFWLRTGSEASSSKPAVAANTRKGSSKDATDSTAGDDSDETKDARRPAHASLSETAPSTSQDPSSLAKPRDAEYLASLSGGSGHSLAATPRASKTPSSAPAPEPTTATSAPIAAPASEPIIADSTPSAAPAPVPVTGKHVSSLLDQPSQAVESSKELEAEPSPAKIQSAPIEESATKGLSVSAAPSALSTPPSSSAASLAQPSPAPSASSQAWALAAPAKDPDVDESSSSTVSADVAVTVANTLEQAVDPPAAADSTDAVAVNPTVPASSATWPSVLSKRSDISAPMSTPAPVVNATPVVDVAPVVDPVSSPLSLELPVDRAPVTSLAADHVDQVNAAPISSLAAEPEEFTTLSDELEIDEATAELVEDDEQLAVEQEAFDEQIDFRDDVIRIHVRIDENGVQQITTMDMSSGSQQWTDKNPDKSPGKKKKKKKKKDKRD